MLNQTDDLGVFRVDLLQALNALVQQFVGILKRMQRGLSGSIRIQVPGAQLRNLEILFAGEVQFIQNGQNLGLNRLMKIVTIGWGVIKTPQLLKRIVPVIVHPRIAGNGMAFLQQFIKQLVQLSRIL